jgi:hypothetical protein
VSGQLWQISGERLHWSQEQYPAKGGQFKGIAATSGQEQGKFATAANPLGLRVLA